MNIFDALIVLALIALLALAVRGAVRRRKKGGCGCGCGSCTACKPREKKPRKGA